MKKAIYLILVFAFALVTNTFGQKPMIELTFTAEYYNQYVSLDSIYVENLTQGGDTILYAPDTVLVLDYTVGVSTNRVLSVESFQVSQNRPNPFAEQTIISIFLPEADHLLVSVINLLGQKVAFFERSLDSGSHSFVFYPGDDKYYILTATASGLSKTIKMVSMNNNSSKQVLLNYQGLDETQAGYKSSQDINDFGYSPGDQLRFIGYATTPALINGSDVIEDAPLGNQTYTFEIIEGLPCPGIPTVTYEGQTYSTVQIGNQCWFKENLNIGTMIDSSSNQTNNSLIEKYCYSNDPANCSTYGGLYQWDEMMQYTTPQGTQGICPAGWHLPSDTEWTILTDFLGGEIVAGGIMKETGTLHWFPPNNGATNESGFTGLPGGARSVISSFAHLNNYAYFWSTTEGYIQNAWCRDINFNYPNINRSNYNMMNGLSVRCVKDQEQACPGIPTITDIDGNTYNTVLIGDQCWIKENLKTTTYSNGTAIPNVTSAGAWENLTSGAYVWYDNDITWKDKYGVLYNWYAAVDPNGLCPVGWHVPTNNEWTALTDYIGGTSSPHSNELKSCRQVNSPLGGGCNTSEHPRWEEDTYNGNYGTDDYGFSGLPGGGRYVDGTFSGIGGNGYWWSSTDYSSYDGWLRYLHYGDGWVYVGYDDKRDGFSVRCLQD